MRLKALEDCFLELGSDADSADSLDVRVAADGHQAGARLADHTAHQSEIGDGLHVLNAVNVMSDAHSPGEDHVFSSGVAARDFVNFRARDAGFLFDLLPCERAQMGLPRGPTFAVAGNEFLVVRPEFERAFGNTMHQCRVTANVWLDIEAGDFAAKQEAADVARDAEVHEAGFSNWIDDDDFVAATAKVFEDRHEARMVARRVRADEKH